jgi:hypothetical protein
MRLNKTSTYKTRVTPEGGLPQSAARSRPPHLGGRPEEVKVEVCALRVKLEGQGRTRLELGGTT